MELTPLAALLILPAFIAAALVVLTWNDQWGFRSRLFSVFLAAIGFWSLTEALIQASPDMAVKIIFLKLQFLAVTTLPVWWRLVIIQQAGNRRSTRFRPILSHSLTRICQQVMGNCIWS